MNPAKLKSLVDQQNSLPDTSSLAGMPPESGADDGEYDEDEGEDEAPVDPLTRGQQLLDSWGEQGEALKDMAGELVDSAHEIGGDLLLETVPEEAEEAVEDDFEKFPEDIQVALAQRVAPLADGDLSALVAALSDGHDGETETPDAKLMKTYLGKIAALAKDEVDPEDFVKDEDDDDEDKDDDGDKDDTGEHPPVADGQSASPVEAPGKPLA